MNHRNLLLSLLMILFCLSSADAQRRRKSGNLFRAGAMVGFNAAQVDGDGQRGFRNLGLLVGLRGIVVANPRLEVAVELLFSQKGARPSQGEEFSIDTPIEIDVNYAEVPLMIRYYFGQGWDDRPHWQIATGFSYSRLVSSSIRRLNVSEQPAGILNIEESLRDSEFSWLADLTWYPLPRLGFGLRTQYAMTLMYKGEGTRQIDITNFQNYLLNLHAVYLIP